VTARLERPLVALLAVVAMANAAVWARTIPYDHAPDEFLHYAVPAFIADHGRLPVFGPDADMYASTQPPDGSPYSGAYYSSYALFPGLSYLASAGLMRLAEATHPTAELFAARLPSVVSLPATVWLAYLCAATLSPPGRLVRLVVPASVASLPELTFVASYTNTDAYTIAAATLTVFAWCYGARTRWPARASVLLGVSVGLVLLGKYTAYLMAPLSLLIVLSSARRSSATLVIAALVAIAVSGWWFVRNTLLYQDPLGFAVQAAAVRTIAPDFAPPEELTRDPVYLLTQTYWLPVTLESAFARFDYMSLWLPRAFVTAWSVAVTASLAAIVAWLASSLPRLSRRRRVHLGIYVALFLVVLGAFVEDIVYTLSAGNSPQGRYLLFASVPFFLLVAVAVEHTLRRAAWALWALPLFLALANAWSYLEVIRPAYSGG
jgi:4-amino-4-deoxy-L-arabinose transferase-like glycosyltransferase